MKIRQPNWKTGGRQSDPPMFASRYDRERNWTLPICYRSTENLDPKHILETEFAMRRARTISDQTYPEMHRLRWPDGKLSDMANLSRAHDAAARFNESLERELRGRQKPSGHLE
jgi:hypothetical protein